MFEHFTMTPDCSDKSGLNIIRNAKLSGGFFYNVRQFTIVYMAYVRKEVVLNLVIESPDIPGKYPAVG